MSKIKYFSEDEIKRFFDVVKREKNIRDLLFFKLMYHYGLRLNEALHIKLKDITSTQIQVNRLKASQGRTYDMRIDDRKLLNRWLGKRKKLENAAHNEFLFITSRSGPDHMSEAMGKKLHTKYCDLSGDNSDKRTNIHAWRHSCAISLLMSGFDINYVRLHMGHKSIQSTLVYAEIAAPEFVKLSKAAIENGFSI
jgi:integrase